MALSICRPLSMPFSPYDGVHSQQRLGVCRAWQGTARTRHFTSVQALPQQMTAQQAEVAPSGQSLLPQLPPLNDSYEGACAFSSFANWVLPGALLVGRYPYVEPSRCTDPAQGEEQLRALLDIGVRVFVSLQQELPPQAEVKIGGVGGFLPYKPTAQLLAAAMSDPPSLEELSALRTPELDRFLPPRRGGRPNLASRRRVELQFVHFPVPDLGLPEEAALQQLIDAELLPRLHAAAADSSKGVVYMHCWGGRGRVGTAAACLLAQAYRLNADEALERVQRAFDTRLDGSRRSPETDEQHAFVRQYIEKRAQ